MEERQRLASEKTKRRSQTENQLAQLERSIDRLWADYEKQRVPVEIAGPRLKEMQAQKTALQGELADLPDAEKLVELHPAALVHYEKLLTELQSVFAGGISAYTVEPAEKIRNLIARIIIHPKENGYFVELQGRLALLMGAPEIYPQMRIASSGGTVVAGVRSAVNTRDQKADLMTFLSAVVLRRNRSNYDGKQPKASAA